MKKGIASSRGAISILNAIPTGIGSAMGITLQTDAMVTIEDGKPDIKVKLEEPDETGILARECVTGLFEACGAKLGKVTVDTHSTIPISRGLKSSSAAANAITLATTRALGVRIDDIEIVKLGVEAAKRAGVTVTGAFDDAAACYFGGVIVTDNTEMKILRKCPPPRSDIRVILHVPQKKIRKNGLSSKNFIKLEKEFEIVEALVLNGEYFKALTENGRLVAKSLDLDDEIAKSALDAGAIAAGISGTGPATAILVDHKHFDRVLDAVTCKEADTIVASLNVMPAPEVEPRH